MSHHSAEKRAINITDISKAKLNGKKISMITCYDSAFGRIIESSEIDMVLVGDSLGNVVLGYESTIPVTIGDMVHHTKAVSRVCRRPFLVADMPFLSYTSTEQAVENARKLVQDGGASAVKLEGGSAILPQVQRLVELGIPVMGHLGLKPQSVNLVGGYKVQAKEPEAQKTLIEEALLLQKAGVFAIVFEMIPSTLAEQVTKKLNVPTIGIGAGPHCDGQVLVLHDMLGFVPDFNPKFLKKYANLAETVKQSIQHYCDDVKTGVFPAGENSF